MEKATPQQIQEFKTKYGPGMIFICEVKDGDDVLQYVLRKPNRSELEMMAQHGVERNVTKTNQVLIANCVLHGDMDLIEKDGQVYSTVLDRLNEISKKKESTLVQL